MGDLETEEGYVTGPFAVRRRSEESDEAPFACQSPVGAVELHTDIVHMHAAMYDGSLRGLGDYKRFGPCEERLQFRGKARMVCSATDDPRGRIGKKSEAAFRNGLQTVAVRVAEGIIATAQKGEMVVTQPFQKSDAFVQQFLRDLRRMRPEIGDCLFELLEHPAPIAHGETDLGEDTPRALDKRGLTGLVQCRIEDDDDHTFAHGGAR